MDRLQEEWMSIVIHDLRQPLQTIMGRASLLRHLVARSPSPEPALVADNLRHIQVAAANVGKMINDLLDSSRLEAKRMRVDLEPTDLISLTYDIVERSREVMAGHGVRIEVRRPPPLVAADPGRLEQVLGNLLSNAAKYGELGTEILLEVNCFDHDVQVSVVNRGRCIEREHQSKLFSRFQRAWAQHERIPGIGLGLYISKGLIEAHGGCMWHETTAEGATAFRFTLPVEAGPQPA
jgi:signal transduction histidine kinase